LVDSKISNKALEYVVGDEGFAQRVDKYLTGVSDLSRARIQSLVQEGCIYIDGQVLKTASQKLKGGEHLTLTLPDLKSAVPKPENIPLEIVYEDEALIVLNKAAGMVVHPGAGNHEGTLVNALLHHCKGSLSGIGGVERPGIVHRLDKDTSGLMVVAKTDHAHNSLSAQLADRSLSRIYEAIVLGVPMPLKGKIDKPIGRSGSNRLKMSVKGRGAKEAVTFYKVLEQFEDVFSLVECKLQTGRTHQIRVHMQSIDYPLIGDPLYGPQITKLRSKIKPFRELLDNKDIILNFSRQALHAREISFVHPVTENVMIFEAERPMDMGNLLKDMEKL
tara:strand:+ start:4333 stop:5328 length:996 start_codon:yes stop_codon:yes gene_type:complete